MIFSEIRVGSLSNLKSPLNDNLMKSQTSENSFADQLATIAEAQVSTGSKQRQVNETETPFWVRDEFPYDPTDPRKPNMRELMETLTGRNLEALYADPNSNWRETSKLASELLYGTIGNRKDTRNWNAIMQADDIVSAARTETSKLLDPKVSIQENLGEDGELHQKIILKTDNNNLLREVSHNLEQAKKTFLNFGVSNDSFNEKISLRMNPRYFSQDFISFIKDAENATFDSVLSDTS